MQVDVALIFETYKEEINKLTNDNILLRAQLKQLQNELEKKNEDDKDQR